MAPLWKLAEARAALTRGEDVNNKNSFGWTALMLAVCNANGTTALMWAVSFKHNSIVKLLLDQPAVDVNVKDDYDGLTALHYAALDNNAEGARMLLLHKDISANVTDNNGKTALMLAVSFRNEEVLRELVSHQCVSLDVGEMEEDLR